MFESLQRALTDLFALRPAALSAAAEVLIIALCVYMILRFLRGTRGASLFRGVAFVLLIVTLIVKVVAEQFNLDRILAIYREFVLGVFFIGIIVFQPELRRALMRLGAAGWLPGLSAGVGAVLDEVIQSVAYMSKNKVGALIAIERGTELGSLIASGCKLDAEISAPLLNTIFWPGSALHDMGVVISQDRIAAAAVLFPLTESASYQTDQTLGSRHRAAIGLSEESDAVIVVVSEETGTISLAENGHLHRSLTIDQLRDMLNERLVKSAGTPEENSGE